MTKIYGDGGHFAATSLPCLATLDHLTADKRFRYHFTQSLLSQTSFICNPLSENSEPPL